MTFPDRATPALEGFRAEVRRFVQGPVSREIGAKYGAGVDLSKQDHVRWHLALAEHGWLTALWPAEYGGQEWSVAHHHAFEEEVALAGCPPLAAPYAVGVRMVGPILCHFGDDRQKREFLPRISSCTDWWCQGYSEPGAGSDLAALRTRADRKGDSYVLSGSKTWTSYAHWADWMVCLARTGMASKPQEGITFLLVNMKSPGVTVRPIQGANGRHFFNEVFLDEVIVPIEHRVGMESQGWSIAKALLEHERLAAARVGETKKRLAQLRDVARRAFYQGQPLLQVDWFRRRLWDCEIEAKTIECTVLRYLEQAASGKSLGPEISMLKVRGTELLQEIMDLIVDTIGPTAAIDERDVLGKDPTESGTPTHEITAAAQRHYYRGLTLAAGTSEVQRNVLAKQVLGI